MGNGEPWCITQRIFSRTSLLGIVAGLLVAIIMTIIDWRANPGGVFVSAGATNWAAVAETAWSWFWPIAALTMVLAAPVVYLFERQRTSAQE